MKKLLVYSLIFFSWALQAQDSSANNKKTEKDNYLPKGNDAFEKKNYADAEAEYRISQAKFAKKAKSSYNLGTAIYQQKQSTEAKYQFAKAIKNAKTKAEKHQAFHNLGNCLMNDKNYEGAVETYKNALRNNPTDEETRYNYALAKLYLKNNPPKKDGDGKDKKQDNKDDKKDDKDKKNDKKEDKKDDKKEDKKDDKNKEGQNDKDKNNNKNQGQPKEKPGQMSKQRVESLLDAVNNEEKKVQDKVNLQKANANPKRAEKDW